MRVPERVRPMSMFNPANRRRAANMLRLAGPIILTRAGWMFMSFVDVFMVGQIGRAHV